MSKYQVDLDLVRRRLNEFSGERDWEQFHSPKNLAMALSVEASELVELFQWADEGGYAVIADPKRKQKVEKEKRIKIPAADDTKALLEVLQNLNKK